MGNVTEFERVALILEDTITFDTDINVSVFETNIRGTKLYNMLKIEVQIPFFVKIVLRSRYTLIFHLIILLIIFLDLFLKNQWL